MKLIEALDRYCGERGRSLLELAISWLLSKPVVASVIAGATRPQQLVENASAARWSLTEAELADIERIRRLAAARLTPMLTSSVSASRSSSPRWMGTSFTSRTIAA